MKKNDKYIHLIFDEPTDHPYYVRGHLSKGDAQEALALECDVLVKSVKHLYGRFFCIGPDHEESVEGCDKTFRVIDEPRRTYYAVTECEPDLSGGKP